MADPSSFDFSVAAAKTSEMKILLIGQKKTVARYRHLDFIGTLRLVLVIKILDNSPFKRRRISVGGCVLF